MDYDEQIAIILRVTLEKTVFSPGERLNVTIAVETNIPLNFKRFYHLPKVLEIAYAPVFPKTFKKGDKIVQKISFLAPSGQVPSEYHLIFEFIFEKDDTSSIKITTVPLLSLIHI